MSINHTLPTYDSSAALNWYAQYEQPQKRGATKWNWYLYGGEQECTTYAPRGMCINGITINCTNKVDWETRIDKCQMLSLYEARVQFLSKVGNTVQQLTEQIPPPFNKKG